MKTSSYAPKLRLSLSIGSILLLSACTSLSDLGDAIDPPPNANGSGPIADSNGVISYPTYQVVLARSGDSVNSVASRIGVEASLLAAHNGVSVGSPLREDQVLIIPDGVYAGSNGLETIAGEALDSVPDQPSTPSNSANEPLRHTVQAGETAYGIAKKYGVSVTSLASWNGLGPNLELRTGQRLLIPASGVAAPQPTTPPPAASTPTTPKPTPPAPAPTTSSSKFLAPVDGNILRGFSKKSGGNEGIDYAAPTGTAVRAAADGKVALISESVGSTTIVLVRHSGGLYTVYSNINSVTLKKGASVKRGQTIGKVAGGSPSYVHFEVRKGTDAVDPTPYM